MEVEEEDNKKEEEEEREGIKKRMRNERWSRRWRCRKWRGKENKENKERQVSRQL